MKTYCIREVVHYHVEADSADEAEEIFLNGNLSDFYSSVEERDVSEI
jgi:hypothetical protein